MTLYLMQAEIWNSGYVLIDEILVYSLIIYLTVENNIRGKKHTNKMPVYLTVIKMMYSYV